MHYYSYQISPDNQIIHETYSGLITWYFLKLAVLMLTNDPCFKNEYDTIVDLTNTTFDFTFEELKQFNQVHNTVFESGK